MRRQRIYTSRQLSPGMEVGLEPGPSHHLAQVLRLRTGSEVILFNGDGWEYTASITDTDRRATRLVVTDQTGPEEMPGLQIHLGLAISKGERMDFALQKSVELGVASVTPLQSRHGNVRLDPVRMEKRLGHWQGVIVSACEQSGRCRLPPLHPMIDIDAWLDSVSTASRLLLDPAATATLDSIPHPGGQLTILTGPEGGLSDGERKRAGESGFMGIRLGPRVLRTETAPIAAIAAAQMLWGDFRGC